MPDNAKRAAEREEGKMREKELFIMIEALSTRAT
jgi:hypothetical protein